MIKKFFSYLYPFVENKVSSFNGTLKIVLVNGRKILNTQNANYSYGSLHRIMRFALGKIDFQDGEKILLLGLGAGSVIDIIRNDLHVGSPIVAVDFDPVVIEVARGEFHLDSFPNTQIICQDAYEFVQQTSERFGLIVIDLFINNVVPKRFYDDTFWENVSRILSKKGQIIFNTIIKTTDMELFQSISDRLEKAGFTVSVHEKVDVTNVMVIAKRG